MAASRPTTRTYTIAPDGAIVWIEGPEDYQYVWEEIKDNLPQGDWD